MVVATKASSQHITPACWAYTGTLDLVQHQQLTTALLGWYTVY